MTSPTDSQDELLALRRRAYGPNADIHHDSRALARLRDLEHASRQPTPADTATTALVGQLRVRPVFDEDDYSSSAVPSEAQDEVAPSVRERLALLLHLGRRVLGRLARVRRSTVLIGLGAALIVAALVAALVLVQRVQVDPLQSGSDQVARLALDPSYEVPGFFLSWSDDTTVQAFQGFYGLRVLVADSRMFGAGREGNCLIVYSVADVNEGTPNSFDGPLITGCEAGAFPAMAQFIPDAEGFPDELGAAFPAPGGLQFVYDRVNREVVVFAGE